MIKNILFDFDGVIIDSMPVREYGFRKIFQDFDTNLVDKLITYHELNGGLSRFVKIKYFYEELLHKDIDEELILEYANNFSKIMKKELINKKYLIRQTVEFITNHTQDYNLHIVSGSEQSELRYLCKALDISQYFNSIHGSPTHKNILVKELLDTSNYNIQETILIGDSINDYEAAKINNIDFYGYNNTELRKLSKKYLFDFKSLITNIV